jgi:hypothetical protein
MGGWMLPTDIVKAVYVYSTSTLVLHRADGDTVSEQLPATMCIRDVEEKVKDEHGDLPFEVKCSTVFGLLVSAGKF